MPRYYLDIKYKDKDEARKLDNRCWWDNQAKLWWTNAEHSPLIQKYGLVQLKRGPKIIEPLKFSSNVNTFIGNEICYI